MSAFSFTAPFITEEEEKAERLALSASEKEQLERDLYGQAMEFPDETHDLLEDRLAQLDDALDGLDPDRTAAYHEARDRSPKLVQTESDPVKFLRCCEYDAGAAARRLVDYWQVRRDLFGDDRAYRPMTLGHAMAADRFSLEKAMVQVLPDDVHGRPVLFWDRIRSNKSVIHRDEVARIHFYLLHIMTMRVNVQKFGFVWMVFLKGFDLYMHFDRILDKRLFKVMYTVPAKFRAIHTFTGSGQSVVGLTMPVLKHMGGAYYRLRLVLHAGSDKELLEQLALYGITGKHLDAYVGGRYNHERDHFIEWLERERRNEMVRARFERRMTC